MNRENVLQLVVGAVTDIQRLSGRDTAGIGPAMRPVGGLAGFDSLNGLETVTALSGSTGLNLPDDLFIASNGRRGLSIDEVADRIWEESQGVIGS